MRPPTILHYLGYDEDRGGVLTAVRQLAAPGGARHVLAVNRGFVARRRPCLKVWRGPAVLPETISPGNAWLALRAAAALVRHTARRRLVVHGQSRAGLLVALWLWLLGQDAIVVSPHCYGRRRWFYRWAAGCLGARWTWLSPAMKRHYDAGTGGWAGCLPEPAPPAGATPARPRHRRAGAPVILGGAGTLVEWKGWHLVVEALALLDPAERARLRFVHLGDGDGTAASADYGARLRRATASAALDDRVEWRGWRDGTAELLGEIDALVIPSRDEPMALAGLEALAAGVPLVLADSGGLNDLVTPGRNALVFRTGDAADLAARLRELLATDFLARARITAADLAPVGAARVAEGWNERYREALGIPDRDAI